MYYRIALLLCLCSCFCYAVAQNYTSSIQGHIDSLNKVQPTCLKRVRPSGRSYIISIKNQQEFDKINERLLDAIHTGRKNIKVVLAPGYYCFKNNHIHLSVDEEEVSISITGYGATLSGYSNFDSELSHEDAWTQVLWADSLIEIIDEKTKLCFIPYKNSLSLEEKNCFSQIQITAWFRAPIYNIIKIDEKGVYFIVPNLRPDKIKDGKQYYNIHWDYTINSVNNRFRLLKNTDKDSLLASCFLQLEKSSLKIFSLRGVRFDGCATGSSLLDLKNVKAGYIEVKDCSFENIQGGVAYFDSVSNVLFTKNTVDNTYGHEVRFINNCNNVHVTYNQFSDCGQMLGNTFCVVCYDGNYYVANNTFCDFGYGAIGVGLYHEFDKKYYSGGIVEHNEMYFTKAYFDTREQHTVMDGGAIYVWTQNDDAIIRYNYIHDYTGMWHNVGIFCDDGASNVTIYNNVILNTPDNFSIDSRRVKDKKKSFPNNTNNFVAWNIVDGPIRFMGYESRDRHCWKGANLTLKPVENSIDRLDINEEDILLDNCTALEDGRYTIPKKNRKIIYSSCEDRYIKRILKRMLK